MHFDQFHMYIYLGVQLCKERFLINLKSRMEIRLCSSLAGDDVIHFCNFNLRRSTEAR
ncbi:hypothetical protein PRUPE_4G066200 [Prunus persica]|uniref:Uncharacterized protein n=1 Tax=Prunus persica TaxID=3760 RepID=A0A251PGP7_PRUPE|nr:hypothetical protein PRUPE_4G066200 [Prunus persica]